MIHVFLDLDGVLANFEKEFLNRAAAAPHINSKGLQYNTVSELEDALISHYQKRYKDQGHERWEKRGMRAGKGSFWKIIQGDITFWESLEWMPDGQQLFDECVRLKQEGKIDSLNILSSPSSDPLCAKGKINWVKSKGIAEHVDMVVIQKDKAAYAAPNHVLIDDTKKKIDSFVAAGGIGILHTDTQSSLAELSKVLQDVSDVPNA
jgi:hypothetical protein